MIYRLLNNNSSYHFIALPILTLVLWIGVFVNPVEHQSAIDVVHMMPLYQPFYLLMQWSMTAANILTMLLTLATAFMIVQMNHRFLFLEQKTFLPGYLYVIIVGGLASLHYLSALYIVNIFGVLALTGIFKSEKSESLYANIFNMGLIFGLASLVYFNIIFLFPLVWIVFHFIHRGLEWRHLILPILGLILPWFYAFTYYSFANHTSLFFDIIKVNFLIPEYHSLDDKYTLMYVGFLAMLMFLTGISLIKSLEKKGSTHRYFFQTFLAIIIMSILIILLVPSASKEVVLLVANPIACILANYCIVIERKLWSSVLIYSLIFMIVYLQFV